MMRAHVAPSSVAPSRLSASACRSQARSWFNGAAPRLGPCRLLGFVRNLREALGVSFRLAGTPARLAFAAVALGCALAVPRILSADAWAYAAYGALLAHGADRNARNKSGKSAADVARGNAIKI